MLKLRLVKPALALFLLICPLTSRADPESDVREAVSALSRSSYAWQTTTRQRFTSESTEPRLNPNAPVEVQGSIDPNSFTVITLMPSRELAAPVTAVFRMGDVVGQTPLGWLRRTEIRKTPGPDHTVDFEGKQVRLSRVFSVALRATTLRPPSEQLFDLIADVKSYRTTDGLIVAELRDRAVEQLWGDAKAKSAPEIQGTVIFKLSEQGVTEYHLVLGIGFPNSRTKKIAWSMMQWSTRITGIGSTSIEPPAAAVRALEE